jgi:hypothetical protein
LDKIPVGVIRRKGKVMEKQLDTIDSQHTPRLIKEFTYNNMAYLEAWLIDLKIEFKCGYYEVYYNTGYGPEKIPESIVLNAIDSDKLDEFFAELNIKRWKANYIKEYILDGESWTINVTFFDGTTREITGCNHYPTKWPRFEAMLAWIQEKYMSNVEVV